MYAPIALRHALSDALPLKKIKFMVLLYHTKKHVSIHF